MGGRGSSSNHIANKTVVKSRFANKDIKNDTKKTNVIDANAVALSKMPKQGTKVQESFIGWVKDLTNVDLSKARENRFDDRRGFNIDTRNLTRNELNAVKTVTRRYKKDFRVNFLENGANRLKIEIVNLRHKK